MRKDVVDDIFDRVKQILGDKFNGEVSVLLEKEEKSVRKSYGGESHYIGHQNRRETDKAKQAALVLIKQGVSVKEASKKAGVCHDVVYRILRKRTINSSR